MVLKEFPKIVIVIECLKNELFVKKTKAKKP